MFEQIPLWAELLGLAALVIGLVKVVNEAWYRGTIYQVKRMQDKGEIPEMTKMQDLEAKVDATALTVDQTQTVVFELEHVVKNGLTDKAEESHDWQQEYGPKIDRLIGAVNEHLRQSGG